MVNAWFDLSNNSKRGDLVIPIVLPDYQVGFTINKTTIKVPDLISDFDILPDEITIPKYRDKITFMETGHAGVLFVDGQKGTTKYFEYGRYDPAELGLVRQVGVHNLRLSGGKTSILNSLKKVLDGILKASKHTGKIEAAFIIVPRGKYNKMHEYARKRMSQNINKNRKPYALPYNTCMTFANEVMEKAGVKLPFLIDPRPSSYIKEIQDDFPRLSYLSTNKIILDEE